MGGALVEDWLSEGGVSVPEVERPPGPGPGTPTHQLDYFAEQVRISFVRNLLLPMVSFKKNNVFIPKMH